MSVHVHFFLISAGSQSQHMMWFILATHVAGHFFFLIPLRKILLYIVEWPKCQWVQLVRYESVCNHYYFVFSGVFCEREINCS